MSLMLVNIGRRICGLSSYAICSKLLLLGINIADALFDNISHSVHLYIGAIPLDWISLVVSLVVNAFATILIGLKTWCLTLLFSRTAHSNNFRYIHQHNLHQNSEHSRVRKILLILVESGLAFCIIQVNKSLLCHLSTTY